MSAVAALVAAQLVLTSVTPTPTPLPYNPDDVTPGVIGFAFTFVIFLAVGALAFDLLRRVRRARYREEVRQKLAQELAAEVTPAEAESGDGSPEEQARGDDGERPER